MTPLRYSAATLFIVVLAVTATTTPALSDLVLSRVDRRIDLTSQIVRVTSTLKVENEGSNAASEILLAFPHIQANNLAFLSAASNGCRKASSVNLPVRDVNPEGVPKGFAFYSVSLPNGLKKGESFTVDVSAVFTRSLRAFPEEITQDGIQLVLFEDSAYFVSPYRVKAQSVVVKLPEARIESYTRVENTKLNGFELKYGPYEDIPAFSYSPVVVHFESNKPFAVAKELIREVEISHWGNVQVTEHYNLVHAGAQSKGEFSRLDYQARPHLRGASAFKNLVAKLPPRAHSVYYRDDIGNISTSNLRSDLRKTELEIEPRYPMFGGWQTAFTIGYGLPLHDFLFKSEGKRFLNFSFGCPMNEVVIDRLVMKVVLPEGSGDISVSVPFPVKQWQETKVSHLDIVGRPVMVLEKTNVVPEHNQHFQVYYKFNSLSMLREPLMLISGFFFLFVACIMYMHVDMSISKSSASYLAKLELEEVQTAVQQVHTIIEQALAIHDKLEASLRELSRSGDVQACKSARRAADNLFKVLTKDLKPLLAFLQSSPQAAQIYPKVDDLVAKEKELQEKLFTKHSMVVESYEKKSSGKDIENRVALQQQKINALKQEVDDLLYYIS